MTNGVISHQEKRSILRTIKGIDSGGAGAIFPIRHADLSIIGYMRSIDSSVLDDTLLVQAMAEARTRHKTSFLTQFDVTVENKRKWLEKGILENDDRVLFLIEAADHTVVGQDGLTIYEDNTFALDGTLRWVPRYGHKDLYVRSGIERAAICFFLLQCRLSTTEVFKDNIANVKNSLRMGHEIIGEYPLFLCEKNRTFIYSKIEDPEKSNTDRILLSFAMTKGRFCELHAAIAEHSTHQIHTEYPPQ